MEVYTVTQKGWEYDDSNYFQNGNDETIKAYLDKDRAQQDLVEQSMKFLRDILSGSSHMTFSSLTSDYDGGHPLSHACKQVMARYGLEIANNSYDYENRDILAALEKMSYEDRLEFVLALTARPYVIAAIELDDSTVGATP